MVLGRIHYKSRLQAEEKGDYKQMYTNIYELIPIHSRQKSFYGKAQVLVQDNGTLYLKSYNTIVSKFDGTNVEHFARYSNTTSRHQK